MKDHYGVATTKTEFLCQQITVSLFEPQIDADYYKKPQKLAFLLQNKEKSITKNNFYDKIKESLLNAVYLNKRGICLT